MRMIVARKLMRTAYAVLMALTLPVVAAAQESERIAAVVNDDIISMRDLEERTKMAMISSRLENSPEVRRRLVPQVLRKLIEERLQVQEATRQGISPSENDIARTLKNIETQNNLPPGGLEAATRRDGIDYNIFMSQIKAEIAWMKLLRVRYAGAIRVSDAEIDAQLAIIKSNMSKPQYLLSEIYLNADNPSQEEEVRNLAERIVQQARQGAPFPALARQFSQTASAAVGGDIGWVYEGQLAPDLEAIVKSLQPTQISNPLRTFTGYHILLLRNRRNGGGFDPANSTLDLAQIFMPVPANSRPEDMRTLTNLVQTTAGSAQNCDDMARLAKEINSPQPSKLGSVSLGALPQHLQEALANVAPGKLTTPVRNAGGVAVFMVCGRKDDSGLPGRDEIAARLDMERVDIQARRLMRDLRRSAIVDIRI